MNIEIDDIKTLLLNVDSIVSHELFSVKKMLTESPIRSICEEFKDVAKQDLDLGFNLFEIVSDTFYKENFHSDILKSIISPDSKHNEGNKYLHIFLEQISNKSQSITTKNYHNAEVIREQGKIDIFIYDKESNHCIIIENKINNAPDMERQIPRYIEYANELDLIVDAIIYLTIDPEKSFPSTVKWTKTEEKFIKSKLIHIAALNDTDDDLYNLVLNKWESATANEDILILLKHYKRLIKYLRGIIMSKPTMDKFFNELRQGNNFETAITITEMLNNLPEFMANKMKDYFLNKDISPFGRIWVHRSTTIVFDDFEYNSINYSIDMLWSLESVDFIFYDRKAQIINDSLENVLVAIGLREQFINGDYEYGLVKKFSLLSDFDTLYSFTEEFIRLLLKLSQKK